MEYQLDLSDYRCPLPILMTKRAIKLLGIDDQLCICLHQDAILKDFILLCDEQDCDISFQKDMTNKVILVIEKKKSAS